MANSIPADPTQSDDAPAVAPWWAPLAAAALAPLVLLVNQKWGTHLTASEILAFLAPIIAWLAAHAHTTAAASKVQAGQLSLATATANSLNALNAPAPVAQAPVAPTPIK